MLATANRTMIPLISQIIYADAAGTTRLEHGELRNGQRVYADIDGEGSLQPFDILGTIAKLLRPLEDPGEIFGKRTRFLGTGRVTRRGW